MDLKNHSSKCKNEHNSIMKIINFRFPHRYKYIGLISSLLIFGFLIAYKFYGSNDILVKDLSRTVMLLFLLLASLSKESFEDEYVNHIRSQSYVLSFICATIYSTGLPLAVFLMDIFITKIKNENNINFNETSAFEVMFMLIGFQLLFFETLKRLERAE